MGGIFMKILFAPDYGDNDYQRCLKIALDRLNVLTFPAQKRIFLAVIISFFKTRPHIIHLHWIGTYIFSSNRIFTFIKCIIFLAEILLCKIFSAKIVWTIHNLYNHEKYHKEIEVFLNRILILISDALVVHSTAQKEKIKSFYGVNAYNKTIVAYQGGYENVYSIKFSRDQACKTLNINSEDINFLFYGNIREYKGLEILLESFKMSESGRNLLVIGQCFNRAMEEKILHILKNMPNVIFKLKKASIEETCLFFAAADIVVLPYLEIFNSALVPLAISMSKSVIYSDIDLLRENLIGCGISFEKGNSKSLAVVINSIKKEDLNKFKDEIENRKSLFSWEKHAEKLLQIYEKISKRK